MSPEAEAFNCWSVAGVVTFLDTGIALPGVVILYDQSKSRLVHADVSIFPQDITGYSL